VVNLGGWLTTIVTRVCLNALRARAARPETLSGARVPDPVLSPADGPTPEQEVLLADSVGLALLVVLDTLTPAERVAFVLHDVFDVPFGEIAPMLDRTPDAARQLASRARHRVRAAGAHAPDAGVAAQRMVVDAFFAATRAGDLATLVELLDPDVVLRTDGFAAGPRVLRGAAAVASAAVGGASPHIELHHVLINGAAGVLITLRGRPAALMAFTIAGGKIVAVDGITDPHRVRRLVS
jgi:RNA polymerase sigma-70 factor (ECF subfamily)